MKVALTPVWTSLDATIVPSSRRLDVITEVLDGEAVLVDPRSGHTHRLNETALAVWRACDGRTTTRQMAARLTQEYTIDFDDALDCVDQLVARFAELNLTVEAHEASEPGDGDVVAAVGDRGGLN